MIKGRRYMDQSKNDGVITDKGKKLLDKFWKGDTLTLEEEDIARFIRLVQKTIPGVWSTPFWASIVNKALTQGYLAELTENNCEELGYKKYWEYRKTMTPEEVYAKILEDERR